MKNNEKTTFTPAEIVKQSREYLDRIANTPLERLRKQPSQLFKDTPATIKTATIERKRHDSKRWNDLYLHTFHEKDLTDGRLTDSTLVHLGQKVACIVTRANYKRSGGLFELRLYRDVCGYDPFTGDRYGENCGGDDLVSESVVALTIAKDKGFTMLSDDMGDGKDVFGFACQFINTAVHNSRKVNRLLDYDDLDAINYTINAVDNNCGLSDTDAFTFRYVFEHIALTPIQLRNVEHVAWGLGIREIARLEGKTDKTVRESLLGVKKKFVKYCKENGLEFDEKALSNIIEKE